MAWESLIHSDARVLGGKPTFKGTRYTVERVLKLAGAGWTDAQIAEEYPGIEAEHVRAAVQFAVSWLGQSGTSVSC